MACRLSEIRHRRIQRRRAFGELVELDSRRSPRPCAAAGATPAAQRSACGGAPRSSAAAAELDEAQHELEHRASAAAASSSGRSAENADWRKQGLVDQLGAEQGRAAAPGGSASLPTMRAMRSRSACASRSDQQFLALRAAIADCRGGPPGGEAARRFPNRTGADGRPDRSAPARARGRGPRSSAHSASCGWSPARRSRRPAG